MPLSPRQCEATRELDAFYLCSLLLESANAFLSVRLSYLL